MIKDTVTYMPRIVLALLTTVVGMTVAARADESPRLVIGIMVDGLDRQYLDLLQERFGPGGFNKLMRDGVVIENVDYGTNLDATAATALIMTGAAASTTSVTGETLYDREAMRTVPAMTDPDAMGNYTTRTFSPKTLLVSTLADEVRIAGGGVTHVFSVAPDPSQAVILAGHSANSALWLNDKTGNWATSTYYREPPTLMNRRNRTQPLSARLDTMQWTPSRSTDAYPGVPEHLTHYPFRYTFGRGNDHRYAMFAASPLGNTEVTDIAGELIDDLKLGTSDGLDMVNIAYTLRPYEYTKNDDNRYELIDSYLRLDKDIERLISTVSRRVGASNTVFFLAAMPPSGLSRRDDEKWGIPYGEFSTKKAKSLLNMYLMAVFGNGEWVSGFHDNQFYLNQKLIKDRGVDAASIRREAASFLTRMSGVDCVYTLDEIFAGSGDSHAEALRRSLHPDSAGDLYVCVDAGWETVDDAAYPVRDDRVHYVKRYAPATAPVFILAPGVTSRVIDTPVDARRIAPTVARILRIRSPNAAALPALIL